MTLARLAPSIKRYWRALVQRFAVQSCALSVTSRQSGAMMVEAVAGLSVVAVLTASAIQHHDGARAHAQSTQLQVSAAAFNSALNLYRAAAAASDDTLALPLNAAGYPIGPSGKTEPSARDCEAIWQTLVATATEVAQAGGAATRYWSAVPAQGGCRYTYSHDKLPQKAFLYFPSAGRVQLL